MKILTRKRLSFKSEALLKQAGFDVLVVKVAQEQLQNYINKEHIEVVIVDSDICLDQELIDACPSLKVIAFSGVDTDNIAVAYAEEQGLQVVQVIDATANAVAELIFAHLFGMVRFLHQSNRDMPLEGEVNFNGLKQLYVGTELRGKTIGFIGMDATAIAAAKIALGLGMNVVMSHHDPKTISIPLDFYDGQGVEFVLEATPLNTLLSQADFISVHSALTEGSYALSTLEFEQMKPIVGIVNCVDSTGLDEVALLQAIKDGRVQYAGLDVFEKQPRPEVQLLMHPDLSLSPNIATQTKEAQQRVDAEIAQQIIEKIVLY